MSNDETTPIENAEDIHEQANNADGAAEMDEKTVNNTNANAQAEVSGLEQELKDARKQAHDYFEGWQRERADFSNYKKRTERDLLTMRFNAKMDTFKTLLPILDDFERAMANLPEDMRSNAWLEGIGAIQRKLIKTLEDEGVQAVDPTGEPFDPNLHEAIARDSDTEVASGHVTATLQKGYICGDRVLRPALVRVAE